MWLGRGWGLDAVAHPQRYSDPASLVSSIYALSSKVSTLCPIETILAVEDGVFC